MAFSDHKIFQGVNAENPYCLAFRLFSDFAVINDNTVNVFMHVISSFFELFIQNKFPETEWDR